MKRLIVGALALTGAGTLALLAYMGIVHWSQRITGEDPLAEPWGDC